MSTPVKKRKPRTKAKTRQRVTALTSMAAVKSSNDKKWWRAQSGQFADDPIFDEAIRLGRAMREASEDKPVKKAKLRARTGH